MGNRCGRDDGGAIVEFLGMTLLLLIPLVYLILGMARIQAAAYAAEEAADAAARAAVVAGVMALDSGASMSTALNVSERRADTIVGVTVEDFGFEPDNDASFSLECTSSPCFAPGSDIRASVRIEVGFPGVPSFVRSWLPVMVTVSSTAVSPIDGFASGS